MRQLPRAHVYRLKIASAIACIFMLTACVPFPHREWSRPAFSGSLMAHGVAVRGADVYVATSRVFLDRDQSLCSNPVKVAVTNADGGFNFAGEYSWVLFYDLIYGPAGIRVASNDLCFGYDGQLVFGSELVATRYWKAPTNLRCDTYADAKDDELDKLASRRLSGAGICSVAGSPWARRL